MHTHTQTCACALDLRASRADTVTVIAATTIDPWADVVGQDFAVAQLQAASTRPIHAYLLVGPRGSGKRQLARAFAATLLASSA